jgi:hypothetical protein
MSLYVCVCTSSPRLRPDEEREKRLVTWEYEADETKANYTHKYIYINIQTNIYTYIYLYIYPRHGYRTTSVLNRRGEQVNRVSACY